MTAGVLAWLAAGVFSAVLPAAPPKETIVIDFTDIRRDPDNRIFRAYEYTYDAWGRNGVVDLPQRGVLIKAPTGKGGLGENRTMARFHPIPAVQLHDLIGNANSATSLTFALVDADGTEHQWSVPLEGEPAGRPLRHRSISPNRIASKSPARNRDSI